MTPPQELVAFEADIANEFNAGKIRAPVHLDDGNERQLIEYFEKYVRPYDWLFCSWRSHYKCLLHGVPAAELKAEIMAGRSISLCFPEYRVVSSAIVAGNLPLALGAAWAIKRQGGNAHVHAFMGDMTALTGVAQECLSYAQSFELPITFVLEDNNKSVCTDTRAVWNIRGIEDCEKVHQFEYTSRYPHAGAGQRVEF